MMTNGSLVAKSRIGMCQTTIPVIRCWTVRIKVKILNNQHNRSTAQIANGVGENPLNGKGAPVTDKADGEEIV